MAEPTNLDEAIEEAQLGPLSASRGDRRVQLRTAADYKGFKALENEDAAKRFTGLGMFFRKMKPPAPG